MNKIILTAVAALLIPAAVSAKSAKRGVCENQFSLEAQMTPIEPGVSWYYNWGVAPGSGYQGQVSGFTGYEFVPMCWNGVNASAIRTYCSTHPEVKYILGFNEPNFTDQANLTPAQAAEKWPELRALAAELGLQVVAPALNYSTGTYANPVKWMDEFVALVGPDAFDYVALHNYGGLGVMKDICTTFYNRYGKKVWVTEWCYWPGGAGNVYVAPLTQIASMIESVEWLEKTDFIFRYAWFKVIGDHNASNKPNYGLEISVNGLGERELSQQGWVYTYMTDFDPNRYYHTGETVAATEYISAKGIFMDKGSNPDCPRPIEISQFNSGASLDYQFEVSAAGTYYLTLTVSGQGEPVRFDPTITIYAVNPDGTNGPVVGQSKQFPLSGSNTEYTTVTFEVNLAAGKQTIRLADTNPYQPSGIHISTLRLSDNAGVDGVAVDAATSLVDVYTVAGVKVREGVEAVSATNGLQPGIYLVGNRKVIVK